MRTAKWDFFHGGGVVVIQQRVKEVVKMGDDNMVEPVYYKITTRYAMKRMHENSMNKNYVEIPD